MASRPRATETRTADGDAAPRPRVQPCLVRIFVCDRPQARPVRYPLGDLHEVRIGRGADGASLTGEGGARVLDLRCADTWMSRAHAILLRSGRAWRVEDAGSKNGTLLAGQPVARATLADGDVLEIGQTLFLYRAAIADLGGAPIERDRPLSPAFADLEDLGLAIAAALTRARRPTARVSPAAARALVAAWPVDVEACLRPALVAAGDAPIGPAHLPAPLPRPAVAALPSFARHGDLVAITFAGAVVHLKDGDGLRYLAYLVERPCVDVHVLDLIAEARSGRALPAGVRARDRAMDLGDAGPLLDARAKAAYQRRLADLRAVADEAAGFGDHARAARAREEIDALAAELARAVGLGGRDRKASAAAERARVNVTLRLRGALKRIAAACPPLGRHLEAALRTGTFCRYQPP